MFGNLGVHIIKYPTGNFGFVGSLPVALANVRDMTQADALGSTAFKDAEGNWKAYHFPVFKTHAEALAYANERGVTLHPDSFDPTKA